MINAILIRTTVATIVAYLGAGVGALIGVSARSWITYLVNAALGALLAVTVFDILPDAKELLSVPLFLAGTASGWVLFWLLGKYVYPVCPACSIGDPHHTEEVLGRTLVLMMCALAVHSTMDGAAVAIGDEIQHGVNLPVFFGISFHKFPEGLAIVLLLLGSGYSSVKAFWMTIGIEATTELGALVAVLFLKDMTHLWLGLIFASVGGGFLYLVITAFSFVHDPDTKATATRTRIAGGIAFAITGVLIMLSQRYFGA